MKPLSGVAPIILMTVLIGPGLAVAQSNRNVIAAPPTAVDPTVNDRVFWESIKDSRNSAEYKAYLEQFPAGVFAALARARLAALGEKPGASAVQTTPSSVSQAIVAQPASDLQALRAGTVFRDCPDCPEMVVIPPGNFNMGSPDSERGRLGKEGPVHSVTLPRVFAVGKYEVTKAQFARFAQEAGYAASGGCFAMNVNGDTYAEDSAKDWRNPGFAQTDNDPVVCVSWNDAKAYTQWLTRKAGKAYRLLTEAEWEYSARAGTHTSRPWGDDPGDACRYANVADVTTKNSVPGARLFPVHACDDRHPYTAPVGSYLPNAFGLHDMIGNVWERTEDCWNDSYAGAPGDGSARTDGKCSQRMIRGGSWFYVPTNGRVADRQSLAIVGRDFASGFRVARSNY